MDLQEALDMQMRDPGMASEMAGRLSFAVTVAADKCGRAYLRPLFAQAGRPLAFNRCGGWLQMAPAWWRAYLLVRPEARRSLVGDRRRVTTWTGASGADRWLATIAL